MSDASATVVADSVSPDGVRLTTVQARHWRPMLAEENTHRVFSRNSASSRARSMAKTLEAVRDDPFLPLEWRSEKRGMSGGPELTGEDLDGATQLWLRVHGEVVGSVERYVEAHPEPEHRLHKSLLNRLLEAFQGHDVVITSTAWENFFEQRCHEAAQPEMRDVAEAVRAAMGASAPRPLREGEWHLPYVLDEDYREVASSGRVPLGASMYPELAKVSSARCANVSYSDPLTGEPLTVERCLAVYDRLTLSDPPHWSPLEHVATPWADNRQVGSLWIVDQTEENDFQVPLGHLPRVGNLLGWRSLRTTVEARRGAATYR